MKVELVHYDTVNMDQVLKYFVPSTSDWVAAGIWVAAGVVDYTYKSIEAIVAELMEELGVTQLMVQYPSAQETPYSGPTGLEGPTAIPIFIIQVYQKLSD